MAVWTDAIVTIVFDVMHLSGTLVFIGLKQVRIHLAAFADGASILEAAILSNRWLGKDSGEDGKD